MKKYLLFLFLVLIFPFEVVAKRGCCSWHGGVSHCGENGRYVCNDGTYSPSCTCTPSVSYKYGCTNQDSINYDSSANRDDGSCIARVYGCMTIDAINYNSLANTSDGSCQFEEEIVEEEEILYSVKVEKGNKNEIKQKGSNGKKKIITRIIKNESGTIISSNQIEEVIVEPVDEIKIEAVVEKNTEEIINENESELYDEDKDDDASGISTLLILSILGIGGYKLKEKFF